MPTPSLSLRIALKLVALCLGLCVIVVPHSKGVLLRLLPHIYAPVLSVLNSSFRSRFAGWLARRRVEAYT